jgi:hypothetical protein
MLLAANFAARGTEVYSRRFEISTALLLVTHKSPHGYGLGAPSRPLFSEKGFDSVKIVLACCFRF